jgi:hypothetical protein
MKTRMIPHAVTVFICLWLALASSLGAQATVESSDASKLFTRAQVDRMTSDQFIDAFDKRIHNLDFSKLGLETGLEAAYDNAAYYYADVKAALHDRQAARVSPALLHKLRRIRAQVIKAEGTAFDEGWTHGMGTMYTHSCNRMCMEMEDAMGDVLRSLQTRAKGHGSAKKLLRRLAALDNRTSGKSRPYHKLARALSGLPPQTIRIILAHEQIPVHWIVDMRREAVNRTY